MNQKPSSGHIVAILIFAVGTFAGVLEDMPQWLSGAVVMVCLSPAAYVLYKWDKERKEQATVDMKMYVPTETPKGPQSLRAARVGAFVENIDMTTLFARDGWRCGICGRQIDSRLRHPNPLAGTLDHIIPLNKGGQHRYGNVQAAHYSCNSSKGDRVRPADVARYKALNGGV